MWYTELHNCVKHNFHHDYPFRFCEKIRDLVDKDFLSISQKFVVRVQYILVICWMVVWC